MQSSSQTPDSSALFVATIVATIDGDQRGNPRCGSSSHRSDSCRAGAKVIGTFVTGYALGHILVGLLAQDVSQKFSRWWVCWDSSRVRCLSVSLRNPTLLAGCVLAGLCAVHAQSLAARWFAKWVRAGAPLKDVGRLSDFRVAPVFAPLIASALSEEFGGAAFTSR